MRACLCVHKYPQELEVRAGGCEFWKPNQSSQQKDLGKCSQPLRASLPRLCFNLQIVSGAMER